ncbi:MAG: hypothetical protein PHZ23_16365 [Acidiphilium sp.]|nr:hypothetical protein [Acidiphilium sp.]
MTYLSDLWSVLKGDGIALDETEAALLGIPNGETISLYEAMQKKHGVLLAKIACAIFSVLIQRHHCANQLDGTPMKPMNYVRATACLIAPIVLVWLL